VQLGIPGLLEGAARRLVQRLPDLGEAIEVAVVELPEIDGGWATLRPVRGARPAPLDQYVDAEHAVLLFGQVDGSEHPAELVRARFRSGGADAVAQLGGVFSALVVDRRARNLQVVTSIPGCRALRYLTLGRALFLSPLDLGIVAASGVDVTLDLEAAAASVACGWAIAGRGVLRGVRECSPIERLLWSGGNTESRVATPLGVGRLAPGASPAALEAQVEHVIAALRTGVSDQLAYTPPDQLDIALTAGVDSRAALALVLSLRDPKSIRTYTRGGTSTRDVAVARAVSQRLGIEHRLVADDPIDPSAFLSRATLFAGMTNGVGQAERALSGIWQVAHQAPSLGGGAGEVFRGYYYNYVRRKGGRLDPSGVARALLAFPLRRARTLRFADATLDAAPSAFVLAAVDALARVSHDPYDLADLFYLVERLGRWGSWSWRRSLGPAFVPFASSHATIEAFRLPSPIGDHALLARVIAKHAPRWLYWLPINGSGLLALEGPGLGRYLGREALRGGGKVLRRVAEAAPRRRTSAAPSATPEHAAAKYFSGPGFELLRESLLARGSVSSELFTRQQLEQQLARHQKGNAEMPVLGLLLSLELWRNSLRELAASDPSRPGR
jgi:hypothetical protein